MAHVYEGEPDGRQQRDGERAAVSRFRPTYRQLSEREKAQHDQIKAKAAELEALIDDTEPGRYRSLAMTALEETVMWAVKGLAS